MAVRMISRAQNAGNPRLDLEFKEVMNSIPRRYRRFAVTAARSGISHVGQRQAGIRSDAACGCVASADPVAGRCKAIADKTE